MIHKMVTDKKCAVQYREQTLIYGIPKPKQLIKLFFKFQLNEKKVVQTLS